MGIQAILEDYGVKVAFAESNVNIDEAENTSKPNIRNGSRPGSNSPKNSARSRAKRKALLFGAMSAGLYLGLYFCPKPVMENFSKGGFYTVLPVAAAFLFSYVHGTFTGNFWTAIGVNASSKVTQKQAEQKTVQTTKRPDRRPRAQASM